MVSQVSEARPRGTRHPPAHRKERDERRTAFTALLIFMTGDLPQCLVLTEFLFCGDICGPALNELGRSTLGSW